MIGNEREFGTFKTSICSSIEEVKSRNERYLENFKEHTTEAIKIKESQIHKHVEQKLESLMTTREVEIENIKKERGKVDSKLKDIEHKMKNLETELIQLCDRKTRKRLIKYIHCDKCNKMFKSHSNLEKHIDDEHGSVTIKCDKCEMSFRSKWRLEKHNEVHNENFKQRRCHYYNSGKECPFHLLGCKFLHEVSEACHFGTRCNRHMCQFRH